MSQTYSKDSFDQFGDDLCEVLLSYLSLEEKFHYECLSKQWKRLIFRKANKLTVILTMDLSKGAVNPNHLELVLKKCPFITTIVVDRDVDNREEVFVLILKCCHYLRAITTDFDGLTELTLRRFGLWFGRNLKKIGFHSNNESNKEFLRLCPNLKALNIKSFNDMSVLFNGTELLFPKLSHISFTYSPNDCNRIGIFCEKYAKNSLQSIEIDVDYNKTEEEFSVLKQRLTKLAKLKRLIINENELPPLPDMEWPFDGIEVGPDWWGTVAQVDEGNRWPLTRGAQMRKRGRPKINPVFKKMTKIPPELKKNLDPSLP